MLQFSKVGQRSRSRLHVPNLWYHWKGFVIRNTHTKYESFISKDKKVMANVKVFKVGQRSMSRSHVQNSGFGRKGLVIRYTHAKYENPISHNKKKL